MDNVDVIIRFNDSAIGLTGWGFFWLFLLCLAIMVNGSGNK